MIHDVIIWYSGIVLVIKYELLLMVHKHLPPIGLLNSFHHTHGLTGLQQINQ